MNFVNFRRRRALLLAATASLVPSAQAARAAAATALADPLHREALRLHRPDSAVMLDACPAGRGIVAVGERGVVLLSGDGGRSWRQAERLPVSVTLTAVHFVDARRGWAVGHAGVVLRSEDGGQNWTVTVDGHGLARAALAGAEAASAGAGDVLLRAARRWVREAADKPLFDLQFHPDGHGVVVGAFGFIFETHDAGKTWTSWMHRTPNPQLFNLYAVRAIGENIYVAGEQGLILASGDAGQSFEALKSPYAGSWFGLAGDASSGAVVAGLQGNAWRYDPGAGNWQALRGAPPSASFVSATLDGRGRVLLANQANQVFAALPGQAALQLVARAPGAPLTHAIGLGDGALVVTSFAGARRLEHQGV